jgi:hypothetical protein
MGNGAKIKGPAMAKHAVSQMVSAKETEGGAKLLRKNGPEQRCAANLRQVHSTLTTARPECLVGTFCSIDDCRAGTLGQGTGMA